MGRRRSLDATTIYPSHPELRRRPAGRQPKRLPGGAGQALARAATRLLTGRRGVFCPLFGTRTKPLSRYWRLWRVMRTELGAAIL